jgi:hypothetical protein
LNWWFGIKRGKLTVTVLNFEMVVVVKGMGIHEESGVNVVELRIGIN